VPENSSRQSWPALAKLVYVDRRRGPAEKTPKPHRANGLHGSRIPPSGRFNAFGKTVLWILSKKGWGDRQTLLQVASICLLPARPGTIQYLEVPGRIGSANFLLTKSSHLSSAAPALPGPGCRSSRESQRSYRPGQILGYEEKLQHPLRFLLRVQQPSETRLG
jgi:hypothetical protein